MYVKKTDARNLLKGLTDAISGKMQETNDFFEHLSKEDDWSFVIKSHALIEATVTRLVVSVLGDERIHPTLERLPLSDGEVGKIAFAKQLGVLDARQLRFIKWFSEIRNKLVHKVENINFSFYEYLASLDKNQKKSLRDTIHWSRDTPQPDEAFCKLLDQKPKIALWLSILALIVICETHASQAELKKKINSSAETATKEHFERQEKLIAIQSKLIEEQAALLDERQTAFEGKQEL